MEDPSKGSSIINLPHDHIFSILRLLPVDSILAFSMTCKRFRSLASSDTLWESNCIRDFGSGCVQGLSASYAAERRPAPWKKIYQQISQLSSVSCIRLSGKEGAFPGPRASHSLNFISDCLVLYGGGCEGGRHLDDTWVAPAGSAFRLRLGRWRQTNSGNPTGRFGQTCTVVGDKLLLFGGINDHGIRQNDTWVGQVLRDPTAGPQFTWRRLNVGPTVPPHRGAHAGCSVGTNWMVIHGGIGLDGLRLSDTWLLDLTDDGAATWHEIQTFYAPTERSGHTLTWIGGTLMILFGGRGSGFEVLNDIWLLDVGGQRPEWVPVEGGGTTAVPKGRMPQPRVGHSATLVVGGQVLIYGGEDSHRRRKNDLWVLDPSVHPAVKSRSQAHAWNSRMLSGRMWKKLQVEGHQPDRRSFHRACADQSGRFVYIFGGMVDGMVQPGESSGLRFDGKLHVVELLLHL